MKNYKIQIIIGANLSFKAPLGYRRFRLVAYLLNMNGLNQRF